MAQVEPAGGAMFGAPAGGEKSPVAVRAQFTAPSAEKPAYLFITATIDAGWHIYSITQAAGGPIATKIDLAALPSGVRIAGKFQPSVLPDSKKEEVFDNMIVESHHGTVTWYAPIELAAGVDPARLKIDGKLTAQACDANSCRPPQQLPFAAVLGPGIAVPGAAGSMPVATTAPTAPVVPAELETGLPHPGVASLDVQGLLWQLGAAFLGGLILNLMPCVLPVISLKILAFLQQAGESRARVFALNVWYSAGLLSVFMILAALAATAGLAWGEQFTLPWFKVAMTALVFVMALEFPGRVGDPAAGIRRHRAGQRAAGQGRPGRGLL